jgi:hypothetical protein
MGSHHSQCFASHQTIAPGDKCFALAIRQQSTYSTVQMTHKGKKHEALGISHSAIYPDAYWTPVGNFIEGVYRENGDIEISETADNTRRLLVFVKLMLENAAVIAEGENPSHDLPFDLPLYLVDNAPFLKGYLEQTPTAPLDKSQANQLFNELASVWEHVDDIAFKHRVFYADYQGRMRPLQFTLMHKRCYDDLLGQVGEQHSPNALLEQGLADVKECSMLSQPRAISGNDGMREMYASMATRTMLTPVERIGGFDDIEYNEEKLEIGEAVLSHLAGKLSKAELLKRTISLVKDRLVMHVLESYKIKLTPKCIWHQDGKNEFGRHYAEFINRVSISVTKGRRNKPRY